MVVGVWRRTHLSPDGSGGHSGIHPLVIETNPVDEVQCVEDDGVKPEGPVLRYQGKLKPRSGAE
jgi:hypothetical protein